MKVKSKSFFNNDVLLNDLSFSAVGFGDTLELVDNTAVSFETDDVSSAALETNESDLAVGLSPAVSTCLWEGDALNPSGF